MAISTLFKALAAVIAPSVPDTYAMLNLTSAVNEVAVQHGVEQYDQGYRAGRDAEAERHPEPLAAWEKELLGVFDLTNLSTEEFAIIYKVIGSHTNGGHPSLMTLWGKLQEAAKDREIGLATLRVTGPLVTANLR